MNYFWTFLFLGSHPYGSVVVPWQDNQRRIPSHHPPAGTSRWVSFLPISLNMNKGQMKAWWFFYCIYKTESTKYFWSQRPPFHCCTGCFCWESVRVTPRHLCSHCAITRKSNISRYYRYALPGAFPLLLLLLIIYILIKMFSFIR